MGFCQPRIESPSLCWLWHHTAGWPRAVKKHQDKDLTKNATQGSINQQIFPLIPETFLSELPEPPLSPLSPREGPGRSDCLKKLNNSALAVADDSPIDDERIRVNRTGLKDGYNPYESGCLGERPRTRRQDLRRLSEWLQIRKGGNFK
jgi:hypothetical protein